MSPIGEVRRDACPLHRVGDLDPLPRRIGDARFVLRGPGVPNDPGQVLWNFGRWPRWMGANEEAVEFARLRQFNAGRAAAPRVGFRSLHESLRAVLAYLREHEPDKLGDALAAIRCFEPCRDDPAGYAVVPRNCEPEVVRLLTELRHAAYDKPLPALDPQLVARQNAEVAAGAEPYYTVALRPLHAVERALTH